MSAVGTESALLLWGKLQLARSFSSALARSFSSAVLIPSPNQLK